MARQSIRTVTSRTALVLAAAVALPLAGLGCTTNKQARGMTAERDFYKEQARANENVAASARAEAQVYRSQLNASARENRSKDEAIADLTNEMVRMQSEYDQLHATYSDALNQKTTTLPKELNDKLLAFARTNANVLDFDEATGVVKFKSDVTFSPGSAELTREAASAVTALARILADNSSKEFDLMVAGHTDSQPVANQATIRKGHKDNWYLSSHRAISVGESLQKGGVAQSRMAVVGYADQRPVASNASAAGRSKNRRVEVIILPSSGQFRGMPQGSFAEAKHTTDKSGTTKPSGDAFGWLWGRDGKSQTPTASSDTSPAFNK